jgi:hypothetical protein
LEATPQLFQVCYAHQDRAFLPYSHLRWYSCWTLAASTQSTRQCFTWIYNFTTLCRQSSSRLFNHLVSSCTVHCPLGHSHRCRSTNKNKSPSMLNPIFYLSILAKTRGIK